MCINPDSAGGEIAGLLSKTEPPHRLIIYQDRISIKYLYFQAMRLVLNVTMKLVLSTS